MKKIKGCLFVFSLLAVFMFYSTAIAGILVDVEWLKKHKDDPNVRIVAVHKDGKTYDDGHIPGSVKVSRKVDLRDTYSYPPNKMPTKEQFLKLMDRLGIDNDTIVVAYDDAYQFASRMFFVMEMYGHDINKLKILDGGLTAWKAAGLPIEKEATKAKAKKAYKAKDANKNLLTTWGDIFTDVVKGKKKDKVALHDTRPLKEWTGEDIRAIRGGKIPKSIHLSSVDQFMNKEARTFKKPEEIKATLKGTGLDDPNKTIYTFCQGGGRAPHAYVVLKHILGYKDVRVYDGGWVEWAHLTALPVDDEKWEFLAK
jgi:thiosulfate/3-mercaptopyruvate sulfurtransferase